MRDLNRLRHDLDESRRREKDFDRLETEHVRALSLGETEIKCLRDLHTSATTRIEELMAQKNRLQQQLWDVSQDFLKKVSTEANWKRDEKERLRRQVEEEMDMLKKPRICKRCRETFTMEKNNVTSCVHHPGKYLPRPYPLEGYAWSCCAKRGMSSRPCSFNGRHVERGYHDTDEDENDRN